ncbi:MAG: helix-turn-helix domain-containing protein [Reyranellaceae bacterium]
MADQPATLGQAIAQARKAKGLSQKELAEKIMREEGEGSISAQYLNDIEHDRRTPSSDHMIREFVRVLGLNENYVYYLADRMPASVRKMALSPDEVDKWVGQVAFRRGGSPKKGK